MILFKVEKMPNLKLNRQNEILAKKKYANILQDFVCFNNFTFQNT